MNPRLRSLKDWLAAQYRSLDLRLTDEHEEGQPLWQTNDERPADAQLLDDVVGVWMRFCVLSEPALAEQCVEEAVRDALEEVSHLDPRSSVALADADRLGAWQVHVLWIVSRDCREPWQHAIANLRKHSGHAEEIGLDVVEESENVMTEDLRAQGIPALLFRTRALLRLDKTQLPKWLSPDVQFAERLKAVPESIADAAGREQASAFIGEMLNSKPPAHDAVESSALPTLGELEVRHFRNIIEGRLGLRSDGVAVEVVHGPNGTGKSSLFEALSLALFGTSLRMREYLEDTDVPAPARKNYVTEVLRRFRAVPQETTKVLLKSQDRLATVAGTLEDAKDRLRRATGTLLAQEDARRFVTLSASERAALVLRNYSWLAGITQDSLQSRLDVAKSAWQEMLRNLGLMASITKRATVLNRLAEQMLSSKVPRASDDIGEWLTSLGSVMVDLKPQADAVALRWMRLDSEAGRADIAAKIATDRGLVNNVQEVLLQWLKDRSAVLASMDSLAKTVGTSQEAVKQEWPRIQADVEAWATWLAGQRPKPALETTLAASQPVETSAQPSDDVLAAELRALTKAGQLLRARVEHFDVLASQFLPAWQESYPDRCPTCDQSHPQEGIAGVVARIRQTASDELRQSRERYATVQAELKRRQALRAGAGKPPIGNERQEELARLLCLPLEGADSLAQRLMANPGDWRSVLSPMQRLLGGLALPHSADTASAQADVDAVVRQLVTADEQSERKREAPDRWQQLKKRVDDVAGEVVADHLPGTLEAVWREIARAMAPARWNQVADYRMKLELQRGATRLGIFTQRPGSSSNSIPVQHVWNQAETCTGLGLVLHAASVAWPLPDAVGRLGRPGAGDGSSHVPALRPFLAKLRPSASSSGQTPPPPACCDAAPGRPSAGTGARRFHRR